VGGGGGVGEGVGVWGRAGPGPVAAGRRRGPGFAPPAWLAAARVADEVRALRPDYAALLITADCLRPGPSDEASEAILAAAEQRAAQHLAGSRPEDLPQVAQWREALPPLRGQPQRAPPPPHGPLRRPEARRP